METDGSVETSTTKQTTSKWQFSLRETILATTAIAAIFALVLLNPARRTSEMSRQFNPAEMVTQILKDKNVPGMAYKSRGRGGSSSSALSKDAVVKFNGVSDSNVKDVVMPVLMDQIKVWIDDEGYELVAEGTSGKRMKDTDEWEWVSDFTFGYQDRRIRGRVRVMTSYSKDGAPVLIFTLDEH